MQRIPIGPRVSRRRRQSEVREMHFGSYRVLLGWSVENREDESEASSSWEGWAG